MGLFSRTPEEKAARDAAVTEYRQAHEALRANGEAEREAGVREETPEFTRLNDAAHATAQNPALPWHLRMTRFGTTGDEGR